MATPLELDAMRQAIALSALGLGTTSPNPPVGCIVLDKHGQVVGQGYHERKGEPHAEAHALAAAGHRAEGGTAIVTLEPCNHQGRTPPCRQALIDAKVVRVVIALIDPTSRGEGGAAALRAAGIEVEVGVLADEARLVLGPWLRALETGRPQVTWAYLLGREDLARRPDDLPPVVLDHARLLRSRIDVVVFNDGRIEEGAPNSHGAGVLHLDPKPLSAGPEAVLASLHAGGARMVLLSGGHSLATPFLQGGLIDQIIAYVPGRSQQRTPSIETHLGAWPFVPPGFVLLRVERLGDAVVVICRKA